MSGYDDVFYLLHHNDCLLRHVCQKNTPEVIISGIPQPEDFGVMDMAGVLSKASGDLFNGGSLELQNASGGEIFVATFENLPEKDISASDDSQVNIDDFATYLFNEIGLGSSDKNNGVLILFTTEEPHVVLCIGTGLHIRRPGRTCA